MKKYAIVVVLALLLVVVNVGAASAGPELQSGELVIHYVGFGESLYGIASQYGVPVSAIMRANGITNPDLLYAGQPLVIPVAGYGNPNPAPYAGACGQYHTVRAGESLSGIAYRYGLSLDALVRHNRVVNRDMVYVGQRLCVPGGSNYAPPVDYAPDTFVHYVKAGETLSSIAYRYGVDYRAIVRANNLANPSFIWVGQQLRIPGYNPAPVYSPPVYPAPDAPQYAPPPIPPAVPRYDGYNDTAQKSPAPAEDEGTVPPAPGYAPSPAVPELPIAGQPIQVVVNGGESWVGEAYEGFDDPDSITTLVVSTDDKTKERVVRIQSGDYQVKGELGLSPEFGVDKFRFAFRYLPPGDYDVWIDDPDTPSEKVQVRVEEGRRVEVSFRKGLGFSGPTYASPDGWYLASWENPSKPGERLGGWSNILVKTPASGLWVMIESEGQGYQAKCFTGSKGPGMCDLAGLNAGIYYLWIDGTDLKVKTYMDGNAYATFEFGNQPVPGEEAKVGPVSYN